MWRRTYLFLILIRLWFALSPSYLHPDENFQGPEVIAGTNALVSVTILQVLLSLRLVRCRPLPPLPVRDGSLLAGVNMSLEQNASRNCFFQRGVESFANYCINKQDKSSVTLCDTPGSLPARIRSEASSHYGPSTDYR